MALSHKAKLLKKQKKATKRKKQKMHPNKGFSNYKAMAENPTFIAPDEVHDIRVIPLCSDMRFCEDFEEEDHVETNHLCVVEHLEWLIEISIKELIQEIKFFNPSAYRILTEEDMLLMATSAWNIVAHREAGLNIQINDDTVEEMGFFYPEDEGKNPYVGIFNSFLTTLSKRKTRFLAPALILDAYAVSEPDRDVFYLDRLCVAPFSGSKEQALRMAQSNLEKNPAKNKNVDRQLIDRIYQEYGDVRAMSALKNIYSFTSTDAIAFFESMQSEEH